MKIFLLSTITILLSLNAESMTPQELRVGDILLQPLNCWVCSLIEAETESEYSHVGIVVSFNHSQEAMIAESYSLKVKIKTFKEFSRKTEKGKFLEVLRPSSVSPKLYENYLEFFDGKPFDSKFLWEDKAIYCSELVQKLLLMSNMNVQSPEPMTYNKYRKYWKTYFNGDIPDGELGVNPASFKNSGLFQSLGFLE